jgi:hypothetical protein
MVEIIKVAALKSKNDFNPMGLMVLMLCGTLGVTIAFDSNIAIMTIGCSLTGLMMLITTHYSHKKSINTLDAWMSHEFRKFPMLVGFYKPVIIDNDLNATIWQVNYGVGTEFEYFRLNDDEAKQLFFLATGHEYTEIAPKELQSRL